MHQKKWAKNWIRLSVGLGTMSGILLIFQLHILANVINRVFLEHGTQALILPSLIAVTGLIVLRALCAWLKEISGFQSAATVRQNLRTQILNKLESLGPVLSQQKRSGEWVSSTLEQVEAVQGFFAQYLPQMSLCMIVPLMILAVVFSLNWLAGLILLITAPLIPVFMALVGMGAASINQKNFQALSRMSAHFLDVLQGLNTLKLFDRSRAETAKIYAVSEDFRQTTMQTLRIAFLSSGVMEFFAAGAVALLATYLGLSLLQDVHIGQRVDLYRALFILLLAPEFFLPLRELSTHYHARAAAVGAAEELMGILSLHAQPAAPMETGTALEFCNVDFTYPNSTQAVLNDFSLRIEPGEHLALIGPSGQGKSTLLALLLGFIQPNAGKVITAPHSQIGWLSQQPTLIRGTIRSNLLMGNPEATEEALWQALSQAFMLKTVQNFPQGLDTPVGEQNQGLSGGQAQRIALARLYLKNPDIFLLDEPTASLDPDSQEAVIKSLAQQTQGKTVILVTHRPEPLLKMNRVVTL